MLLTVVALVAVFGLASDSFLDPNNIINILRSIAIVTVIAIGVSISLTIGGFDLSVGSTASLANALVISLFVWHGFGTTESILDHPRALHAGGAVLNAFLIVILRIPDMLATLASLFVIQGVAMTYSYGGSITENMVLPSGDMAEGTIPAAFSLLGQVPTIVIVMLVVTVLAQLGLSLTTHGRRMYAIGGNPEAARLSGIRTTRYKVAAYVIASLLAGLGGILLASRIGSSQVNAGGGYLMDAVAAAWIGFSLAGSGKPNALGTPGRGGHSRRAVERAGDALRLFTALPGFAATPAPLPTAIANHDGPIRIAVIRNLGSDDNTTQFIAGAIQEGKKLGFKVSTFLSNGDDAKFQDFVNQAISQKYDGIILSQGRDPYSTALVKKAVDAGIKVSVFDTAVNGEIPGVTVTQQDDASLTNLSFGQLAKDFNGKANIVKLWVAGFRRWSVGDTANKVGAILAKYPKGKIDAIWGTWDAFSQGAYKALKENGRTEIKLYSIDISNQDLQLMREPGSAWKVSVAVDPKLIGATNVRLVANKIAGEATPATYDFKAAAIPQELLTAQPGPVNVASLGKIIPGWGQTEDFIAPWFATLEAKNK
ncbi:hypothetical protein L1887_52579 [Cichorium endivia]|nr:hypothetical protein L1887_52579 [Cichorium endivia]